MKKWFKTLGIKVIKTMAETMLALITVNTLITEIDWVYVLDATLLSGLITILLNIKDIKEN